MDLTDSQKTTAYLHFFMRPNGGKRKHQLGATSVIDELLLGRDTDRSGTDPHQAFMRQFGDHAGVKSGVETTRRKKPGFAMASSMDDVIWGRDFDKSGTDPAERFERSFGTGHAGLRASVEPAARAGKKKGFAMSSTMDSVIWGRDFDQSEDPYALFKKTYGSHAGGPSATRPARPMKKQLIGNSSVMDEVLTGEDKDGSGDTHAAHAERFVGRAGVWSGQKPDRPFRKPGFSMKSTVDLAIWGRDLDQSGDNFHERHFEEQCGDFAGLKTVKVPKSVRNAKTRAQSEPASARVPIEQPAQRPVTPRTLVRPELSPSHCHEAMFQPPSRCSSDTGSRVSAPQPTMQAKRPSRSGSVGSLTSRDYGGFYATAAAAQTPRRVVQVQECSVPYSMRSSASVGSLTARERSAVCGSPAARSPSVASEVQSAAQPSGAAPLSSCRSGTPRKGRMHSSASVGSVTSHEPAACCGSPTMPSPSAASVATSAAERSSAVAPLSSRCDGTPRKPTASPAASAASEATSAAEQSSAAAPLSSRRAGTPRKPSASSASSASTGTAPSSEATSSSSSSSTSQGGSAASRVSRSSSQARLHGKRAASVCSSSCASSAVDRPRWR